MDTNDDAIHRMFSEPVEGMGDDDQRGDCPPMVQLLESARLKVEQGVEIDASMRDHLENCSNCSGIREAAKRAAEMDTRIDQPVRSFSQHLKEIHGDQVKIDDSTFTGADRPSQIVAVRENEFCNLEQEGQTFEVTIYWHDFETDKPKSCTAKIAKRNDGLELSSKFGRQVPIKSISVYKPLRISSNHSEGEQQFRNDPGPFFDPNVPTAAGRISRLEFIAKQFGDNNERQKIGTLEIVFVNSKGTLELQAGDPAELFIELDYACFND